MQFKELHYYYLYKYLTKLFMNKTEKITNGAQKPHSQNATLRKKRRGWKLATLLALIALMTPINMLAQTFTYDFQGKAQEAQGGTPKLATDEGYLNSDGTIIDLTLNYSTGVTLPLDHRFKLDDNGGWYIRYVANNAGTTGLLNSNGGNRNMQILNLYTNDVVTITGANGWNKTTEYQLLNNLSENSNYSYTHDSNTNTYTFTMKSSGGLSVNVGRNAYVHKVEITRPAKQQFSATYDFTNTASGNVAWNNNHFTFTHVEYVSTIAGYQNLQRTAARTELVAEQCDKRIAFSSYNNYNRWRRTDNNGTAQYYTLRNDVDNLNCFSILNLRAGDEVYINMYQHKDHSQRFITAHSSNVNETNVADNNWGWTDGVLTGKEAKYVMTEDGNLDLQFGPYVEIYGITIKTPYVHFVNGGKTTSGGTVTTGVIDGCWDEPIVICRGDITGAVATKNSDNTVTISGYEGKGGSVILMSNDVMYSYTIPYSATEGKTWNFWTNPLAIGRSEDPAYQSLMTHDILGGMFQNRETNPNSSNQDKQVLNLYQDVMEGQNAYLNSETAGLIFLAGKDTYAVRNNFDESSANYGENNASRYIAMQQGGTFIIPGLKKNDQVYMYIDHFGASTNVASALEMTIWNALDALKNEIPDGTKVEMGGSTWGPHIGTGNWPRQYYSAMHFFAKKDGDMKFTIGGSSTECNAKICFIKIYRSTENLANGEPNLIEPTNSVMSPTQKYEFLTTESADRQYTTETGIFNLHYSGRGAQKQKFEVLEVSGNLDKDEINNAIANNTSDNGEVGQYNNGDTTNPIRFRYKSAAKPTFGCFLLRGKDYDHSGQYCLDYADRIIAVGYRQTMKYPYTWDFTDIDTYSSEKFANEATAYEDTTRIWNAANGGYDLHNSSFASNNRNFAAGTQLYANDEFIEEAAGLGLSTLNQARGRNGDFNISPSGIRIQAKNAYSRVFIPEINKTCKVFVRGRKLNNGTGFAAKYAIGREIGYYKGNPETSLTRIALSEDENNVEEAFAYDGNFTNFDGFTQLGENGMAKTEVQLDDVLTVAASSSKTVEFASSGARSVNNNVGQAIFHESDAQWTESTVDGETVITNDNRIYDSTGNAIYDSDNVSLDTEHADNTYYNMVKLPGAASSEGRYITINNIPANSTVTIQAKSSGSDYRHLMVYAGSTFGSGSTFATMIARPDELVSKSFNNGENTTLCFGSERGQLNVYAVYVDGQEVGSSATADSEPYLGYAQVEVAEGSTSGLTLYLNDILIEKIGVSVDDKELNAIGWASESREYYIDHSLTEYFNNEPVKAYLATSTAKDEDNMFVNTVGLTPLTLPMQLSDGNGDPAESTQTGCIMRHDNEQQATVSIFVPDIHDYLNDETISNADFYGNACTNSSGDHDNADETKLNSMESNMMVANLTGSDVPYSETTDEYTFYVLSYRYTDGNGKTHPAEGETPTERFVRVAKGGASGKPHTAYIRLKTSDVKPENYKGDANLNIVFDINGNNSQQTDGIEDINTANGSPTQHTTGGYYTLSGQKVDNPTKPGVYVRNGKKVFVK